jgi:hypothetical protein
VGVFTALCQRIFPGDASGPGATDVRVLEEGGDADLAGEAVGPEGGGERVEDSAGGRSAGSWERVFR